MNAMAVITAVYVSNARMDATKMAPMAAIAQSLKAAVVYAVGSCDFGTIR